MGHWDKDAVLREVRKSTMLSFSRSGGPGGQNVNTRDTKVTARLSLAALTAIEEVGRDKIRRRLRGRINGRDQIVLQASEGRSQALNKVFALHRMETLVMTALRPDKKRGITRPSRGARERRLNEKRRRSAVKIGRQRPETGE